MLAPADGHRCVAVAGAPGGRYAIPSRGRLPRVPRRRAGSGARFLRVAAVARPRPARTARRTAARRRRRPSRARGTRLDAQPAASAGRSSRRASSRRRRRRAPRSAICMATAAIATTTAARSPASISCLRNSAADPARARERAALARRPRQPLSRARLEAPRSASCPAMPGTSVMSRACSSRQSDRAHAAARRPGHRRRRPRARRAVDQARPALPGENRP